MSTLDVRPVTRCAALRSRTLPRSDDDVLLVADDGALAGYLTLWPDAEPFTEIHQLAFVRPVLWGEA